MEKLVEFVDIEKIPCSRIFNMDQTMIRLVNPQPTTVEQKGVNEVSLDHFY